MQSLAEYKKKNIALNVINQFANLEDTLNQNYPVTLSLSLILVLKNGPNTQPKNNISPVQSNLYRLDWVARSSKDSKDQQNVHQ